MKKRLFSLLLVSALVFTHSGDLLAQIQQPAAERSPCSGRATR